MGEVYLNIEARINQIQTQLNNVQNQMTQLQQKSEDTNETIRNEFEKSGKSANALKGMLGTLFSVAAITAFISKMINMRVEWEKQTQVLKTLTGSQIEANNAMQMLKKISETTTSELKEITNGYMRLVSQGIKPTEEQMRRLVDVATSTSRSFTQVAEAIFDAANKNIKGLRDIGIQSKMIGDKIQLTYRNITKEVDFTAQAIADFVIEIGGSQGVMGAGAEAAGTLATSVGNLKESWQSLILEMGESSAGVIKGVLNFFTNIISGITKIKELQAGTHVGSEERAGGIVKDMIGTPEDIEKVKGEIETFFNYILNRQKELEELPKTISEGWTVATERRKKELEGEISYYNNIIYYLNEWAKANEKVEDSTKDLVDLEKQRQEEFEDAQQQLEYANKRSMEIAKEDKKRQEERTEELEKELKRQKEIYDDFFKWLKSESGDVWDDFDDITESALNTAEMKNEAMHIRGTESDKEYLENKRQIEIEYAKESIDNAEELAASIDLINAEYAEKEKQRKIDIAESYLAEMSSLINRLSYINNLAMNRDLARAEGNSAKQEAIKKKYAKREQQIAIARAFISGAEGAMKTIANLGFPYAIPFLIAEAIVQAVEIGIIMSQKFAKGKLNIQGKGTSTSDSIPSMLSRGESVMTAKETQEYYPYLKAMKEGKFPKLQLELMNDFAKLKSVTNNNLNYDNSKEIKELREIRKVLLREQQYETIEGKFKVVRKGNITTKIALN